MQYWRRRSLRDLYFDKTVKDTVSDAEAKKFYDSQVGSAKVDEEVRARHILVESKEKARELFEKVAYGTDFAELAKQNSKDPGSKDQGGDLGYFSRGQMVPQFEEAAFKLQKGEVSQPFETQFGWHILKVDDRRAGQVAPFDAVKERIVAAIIHQKAQQIAGDLRAKAKIEYIDPNMQTPLDLGAEEVAPGTRSPEKGTIVMAKSGAKISPFAPARLPDMPVVPGVRLAACEAGIRYQNRTDLMVAVLDPGTVAAGVLTQSKTCSAPVLWCRASLPHGKARALVVNSGNANAFTGKKGSEATRLTAEAAAKAVGCAANEVYVASTGVIGEPLDAGKFTHLLQGLTQSAVPDAFLTGGARHHDHRHLPQARHPHGARSARCR